jgi:hypothetical protein
MPLAYTAGTGYANVNLAPIVGIGAPSSNLKPEVGQQYVDKNSSPRNVYEYDGSAWRLLTPVSGTSAAMVAGTVTVTAPAVLATSIIQLTANTPGGTQGVLSAPVASITPGVSFVINSSSNTDTSTVNYTIFN